MSTSWIIPSNPAMYDSDAAFHELTEITWSETGPGIQTGDTVYIYLSSPVSAIGTKCRVVATGLQSDDVIDDRRFWRDNDALAERQLRRSWMILRRSIIFDDDARAQLSFQRLQENGLRGNMAGRQRVPATVLDFIHQVESAGTADDAIAEAAETDPSLVERFAERIAASDYTVEDRYASTKTRGSAQRAFADAVKKNYDFRCAITGITTRAFLVASHIVPWAEDETTRLDPSNGICLSTFVDRAFDTGYISIDESKVVHVEKQLIDDEALLKALLPYDGQLLALPSAAAPNPEYLRWRFASQARRESHADSATAPISVTDTLTRIEDIPPNVPVALTDIDPADGYFADFGPGMYCSVCGKQSMRVARAELWAIRHQTREELAGPLWTYCREHLPAREWRRNDTDPTGISAHEIQCSDCFLVVAAGSICDETGRVHEAA
jgi:hypothetical protein